MGFKKENYTLKGLRICVYFLMITNVHSIMGQSHCTIRVEFEPRELSQIRSANTIEEVKFPFFSQWNDLNELRLSDDEWASVSLAGGKRSTLFKGKNLGFALPNGAQISGIELIVEGHSSGEGFAEGQMVRLLDSEGEAVGTNTAKNALPINKDWKKTSDNTDFIWRYGSPTDTWGLKLPETLVNSKEFGYALQVRNKLNVPVTVNIDHIQMIVYYTPLYNICSTHACVPFYVDKSEDPLYTYEWFLPQGFELISDSEEDPAINIGVSYATFGEYEICVESFYDLSSQGICCRKFNYSNCDPSLISGQVFFDQNNDSSNNADDYGIEEILINLYTNQGSFVSSTFTDNNGNYAFSNLLPGQYYIEVIEEIDSLVFTSPNIGLDTKDSDVTGAFGEGTTDLINIVSGDSLTTIDAGFNLALTIGDFVWEDLNGDGIQQDGEPGIEGVKVELISSNLTSYSTKTDANGFYSFTGLPAGAFSIEFIPKDGYVPTIPNNADNNLDSDLIPNTTLSIFYSEGGVRDSIDAGYYRLSQIGDFVWEDKNKNGLQDESEPGINGAILSLKDSNNDIINTTTSDSLGFYNFEKVAPGKYYLEIQTETRYFPTKFQADGEVSSEINSDIFVQDGKFISPAFYIISNTTNLSLDFGLIEKPASLGGFTFLDQNNSGQYDSDEEFVPEVNVFLYNANDEKIDSTQSDLGGFYLFENITPGSYYLIFELKEDFLFTIANLGDDLSDSDVTNTIIIGSTELFDLLPDEQNYSTSAGFQKKPKIGDFIWLDENRNGIQDLGEVGINDVLIELYNDQNELLQTTTSGPNPGSLNPGYYQFTSLDTGNYYIKIPISELYDFAIIDDAAIGMNSSITNENGIGTSYTFNLVGNQYNFDIDAGYAYKKGGIVGEVWIDQNEDGVQDPDDILKPEVFISLYSETGTLLFFRTTNENGQYFFQGLDEGKYFIVFSPIERYGFTAPFATPDRSIDSDVIGESAYGSTVLISVTDGVIIEDIDAGLIDGAVDLEGFSWLDENGDGIQQLTEVPIPNVKVDLYDLNDSLLATRITNIDGNYKFEDILEDQYYLVFTPESEAFINTEAHQGTDENLDDDVTSVFSIGSTDIIEVIFFEEVPLISAGFFVFSSIGDQVFIDTNENGINDNEAGLNDVIVNLINEAGATILSDTTAQGGGLDSGYYLIENIPPGTYTVQFIRPLFYQFVAADQGLDDGNDSDVAAVTNNTGTTKPITISSGTSNFSIDAGVFYQIPTESSISGLVWDDANANGIRDNDELPIPLVQITLENQIGEIIDMTFSLGNGVYTFDNLPEGFYALKATLFLNRVATFPDVGMDDTIDSDYSESPNGLISETFFLATFEDIAGIDLGVVNKLQVGNFVWEDVNNNGTQDANELGIEEIEVTITSENGIIAETTMSNSDGAYQFDNLPAGSYKICANLPSGFNFAKPNIGTDLLDSDVDASGCTAFLDFTSGGLIDNVDIGLTKNGSIIGIAFVDLNGNGVNNLNDSGLNGVVVNLHSATGELLETKITNTVNDIPGIFEFTNIKATDYYLTFEFPEEYIITNPDVGDDLTDSDITGIFGAGSTDLFALPSGGTVISVSGGAYLPASIGDEVWLDENKDGIKDTDEKGVPNIEVIIFRSFGVPFDTTTTDESGLYQFENLKQGLYFIQFVISQEFTISPSDVGINDNIDSDADNTGKTPLISLAHGADLESVDCGIFSSMASLRSVVWNDSNGDGIRQNQEARIPGIRVSLVDPLSNVIESTQTNSLGLYAFQEIPKGEYKIFVDLDETDFVFTSMNMNDDDYHDSDITNSGESEIFSSDENQSILSVPNVDAGLYEGGGIISVVWEDQNADGIYNNGEPPFNNIEASLYTKESVLVKKIISTEEFENLHFNNLRPGEYFIKYKIDNSYVPSPRGSDKMEDNNSDVSSFEGLYITPTFQVLSNEVVTYIDAGFYKGAALTTKVWFDNNSNGIQDDQGKVPSGVYASLFDLNGKSKGTKGINQEGEIHFDGIPKGAYYIKYYALTNLNFTKNLVGIDNNSDVDHSNGPGTTKSFEFNPLESYANIDAGLLSHKIIANEISALVNMDNETENRNTQIADEEIFFDVHPNPAANYLKIDVDRNQSEGIISIRNNINQLVFNEKVKDIDRINLSEFHPGIYYVKYEIGGKSVVKKIIKIQ